MTQLLERVVLFRQQGRFQAFFKPLRWGVWHACLMIAAAEHVTDAAVTVALITAALALVSTVVTAVVAVVNAILERVAAWQSYKRGLYKGLLELIASLAGASDADLKGLEEGVPRSVTPSSFGGSKACRSDVERPDLQRGERHSRRTEAFNELVKVFQWDISSLGRAS